MAGDQRGRGAGAVERGGLENRCPLCGGPRVRIPPSPPARAKALACKQYLGFYRVFVPDGTPIWYTEGVEPMPKHPRLQKRGSRYYLRVKVPADLRDAVGKREIRGTLKTSDPREALRLVRKRSSEMDDFFETHRRRLGTGARALIPASPADLERIVLQAFYDEERRRAEDTSSIDNEDMREIFENLNIDEAVWSDGLNEVTEPYISPVADALLLRHGLSLDPYGQLYKQFMKQLLRANLESVRRARRRYKGDLSERHFDPLFAQVDPETPPAATPTSSLALRELIERFDGDRARSRLTETTRQGYRIVFRALREVLGEAKPVREITREDCRRVADIICSLPPNATKRLPGLSLEQAVATAREKGLPPLHSKTATKYVNNLSALFNWAEYEEYVERNPARRLGAVGAPLRAVKGRVGFDIDQLNRIFRAPFYLDATMQSSRGGRFWVPLLGLWTGMRLGECVQLRTGDIARVDGVDVILVRRDEEGDKRLKTAASERIVPVHSELKKIGFLKFVETTRAIDEMRLFPELPKSKAGYYSDPFQKWFSRFLLKIDAKTSKTSFHSFRHCFRVHWTMPTFRQSACGCLAVGLGVAVLRICTAQDTGHRR
jgi:integrase